MKKILCILVMLLLLVSCIAEKTSEQTTESTPEQTTESTPTQGITEAPSTEGNPDSSVEQSTFHKWYSEDDGYYHISPDIYQEFLADESLHSECFVDFETLNIFELEFEYLYASLSSYHCYIGNWNNMKIQLEVSQRELNIKEYEWVTFEEMGDTLFEMPEKYFANGQYDRYVKVGDAIYGYYHGGPPIIYLVANDCLIELSILRLVESSFADHPFLKNLFDPSTAPAQIDAILAQWEGKW